MKQSGIMNLVHAVGDADIVIGPELDKIKKEIGQPKINWFVKKSIALKVIEYSKGYKISKRQSWLKLCNLKSHTRRSGFIKLMEYHFKNKSSASGYVKNMMNNEDTQINFYKNHVKKWFSI
mgnify:CR=1 FL=1